MKEFDVVIVGASFAGLTLAYHLPHSLRVLVVDVKPEAGSSVESTGLITTKTYNEFKTFFDIDNYITNEMSAICVTAPNFKDHFISCTDQPWIYQTDTKALIKGLVEVQPDNVEVRMKTVFQGVDNPDTPRVVKIQTNGSESEEVATRFLVGADGCCSKVAKTISCLDENKRFLFGYEQVYFGRVNLGPDPEATIYHFWFGEFSLGYGGWLSPTEVDGRPAFRIGLAKHERDRGEAKKLTSQFTERLVDEGIVTIDDEVVEPGYVFGSLIPVSGVCERISHNNVLLIGDAAGYCGAFAADGIKGSVVSAKLAARNIGEYLAGGGETSIDLHSEMNASHGLIDYYRRQMRYRLLWDTMKSDRTFTAMYRIIEQERETFIDQFCDSKDTRRSLAWTVLKVKHVFRLVKYAWFILIDILKK